MRAVSSCAKATEVSARASANRAPCDSADAIASSRLTGACASAAAAHRRTIAAKTSIAPPRRGVISPGQVSHHANGAVIPKDDAKPRRFAGFAEQKAVDAIAFVCVVETHGLESGERSHRGAHQD